MNRVQLMSNTFRSIQQDFVRVFKGTSVERQRSLFCADTVNENMGIAVSKLYLEKYFDRTARIEVSSSFDSWCMSLTLVPSHWTWSITSERYSLRSSISLPGWTRNRKAKQSKRSALSSLKISSNSNILIQQARVIRQKVGYPEYLDDVKSTQLQDNYGQVSSMEIFILIDVLSLPLVHIQLLVLEQHVASTTIESSPESD